MKFNITTTPQEALAEIGKRLASHRIARNLTQAELAVRADIPKRGIERLEAGVGRPSLEAFLSVCCALALQDRLETLLPELSPSPEDIFRGKRPARRVRHPKSNGGAKPKWGAEP